MSAVHCMLPMSQPVEDRIEIRDEELIRRYQSGDASAFSTLVCRHDKKVLGIAAHFTRSPEDAKDIYQEVFYRVYRGLDRFSFRSEFSTWLYRITTNVCISYRAAKKRTLHVSLDTDADRRINPSFDKSDDHAADSLWRQEIGRRVASALNTLSPKQKMAFVLKQYEGLKIREIAQFMGCAEGTIKRYLFIAIDRLRGQLQDVVD